WHSSAPYIQRKTLLVSRNAVRRNSVWAVHEPESLCGIRGADVSGVTCAANPRKSSAGTEIYHQLVRAAADRRAFDVGVARRRCGVWYRAAFCFVVCGVAKGGKQASTNRRDSTAYNAFANIVTRNAANAFAFRFTAYDGNE